MYNVQMKRYSVAAARERLADVLDSAERGTSVVIERRGVRYILRAERVPPRSRRRRRSMIETVDAAVELGQWQWRWASKGVRFETRRRRT
jgi:antitoxin (DNA-binding transcriptional repressor) of toxin-antitoxin stability system